MEVLKCFVRGGGGGSEFFLLALFVYVCVGGSGSVPLLP